MTGEDVLKALRRFQAAERRDHKIYLDLQRLQMRYGFECFMRRLETTKHRGDFILKGAMLLVMLDGDTARNTRDADFQVYGRHTEASLRDTFADIARVSQDDGIEFHPKHIQVAGAGESREYPGYEIVLPANLGPSRLQLRFDVGFGEAITPSPQELRLPVLLDMPSPQLRAITWETVVAEKFEAMVQLGMRNNRMKDFYDIADLAGRIPFEGPTLSEAIRRTFEHRQTALPGSTPLALTNAFLADRRKLQDWKAFLRRHSLPHGLVFAKCGRTIEALVMPVVLALASGGPPPSKWNVSARSWEEPLRTADGT